MEYYDEYIIKELSLSQHLSYEGMLTNPKFPDEIYSIAQGQDLNKIQIKYPEVSNKNIFQIGCYYFEQSDRESAKKCFYVASKMGIIDGSFNYALMNMRAGYDYATDVIPYLERGHDSHHIMSSVNLGYVYYNMQEFKKMEQVFMKANSDVKACYNLAYYYDKNNNYTSAIKYYVIGAFKKHPKCIDTIMKFKNKNLTYESMTLKLNEYTGKYRIEYVHNKDSCTSLLTVGKMYGEEKLYQKMLATYVTCIVLNVEATTAYKLINKYVSDNEVNKYTIMLKPYLDKDNLAKLEKFASEYEWLVEMATTKQITVTNIECCICYITTTSAFKACSCIGSHYCNECYLKVSSCPLCRHSI